jgi:hypothetical protein
VEETRWLEVIRLLLTSAARVVHLVEDRGTPVLVHCSDGWDRTPQLTSLAMLMLDPYYRTLLGFAVLVEKEWLSFGHKFADRSAQGSREEGGERSPVFLQFLDAVHQLQNQFPTAFEFSENLLLFLADEVHLCRFGTFLGNSERERVGARLASTTPSAWTHVLRRRALFANPLFEEHPQVLRPSVAPCHLVLWARHFLRWQLHLPSPQEEDHELAWLLRGLQGEVLSVESELQS